MGGIKTAPGAVRAEYEACRAYNMGLGLYDTVRQNENFFIGRQWEGVNAPDLDKPVMNILKRVVSYFVSSIVSDDVCAQAIPFYGGETKETRILSREFERIIELCRVKSKNRMAIRNAAVDGDACFYIWFDPDADSGGMNRGEIAVEEIDNTRMHFGNPQSADLQKQPWVIVSQRVNAAAAREEALRNGRTGAEAAEIRADGEPDGYHPAAETGKTTMLLKFWKENGEVWFTKTCGEAVVRPPTRLGYRLYPFAWLCWEPVKNSYHGQSCLSGLIPNQIFINKLFAMCMEHVKKMAFPKVAYDARLLPEGWSNRVGEAIPVQGDPNLALCAAMGGADMSAQVMQLIDKVIAYTRDTMGASDAALGNVNPTNTSAIIAVQKSSAMPLELQRMAFYQFVEDYIRVFLEIMRVDYGLREVAPEEGETPGFYDFSKIGGNLKLNVEVGASTYWSEIMQVQTLDNLFASGIISDAADYLESVPDGVIKNKQKLLERLREREAARNEGGVKDGFVPGMRAGGGG